jgi:esterase/lipase superfamily enzyme
MEALRFGTEGQPILAFPTSKGRFYQWEDFGVIGALQDRIDNGLLQVFCVDSVDSESWYSDTRSAHDRIERHMQYERYLLEQALPSIPSAPWAAGMSFGAFHAVVLALRHPMRLGGFIALSGAYDTYHFVEGYTGLDAYYTNPPAFLPGLWDEAYLEPLRAMTKKVVATGSNDPNAVESRVLGELLREKGVDVVLDVHPGWCHDWPFWHDWMRSYTQ